MNQTTWIVGGGVAAIAVAILLYALSGDGITPKGPPADLTVTSNKVTNEPAKLDTIAVGATTTPAPTEPTPAGVATPAPKSSDTVVLHTSKGDITIKVYAKDVPKTSENFTKLVSSGFYNGIRFHRVISGFMIQGGDPLSKDDNQITRWGSGGPGYQFNDEINKSSAIYQKGYKRGIVAMANSGPNTNGSQFFIMHKDYALPPAYTIFGEVTSGLDVVDAIAASPTDGNDRPLTPITITSAVLK